MVRLGIVTGRTIGKNRDGQNDRLLLQVRMTNADDIQTVEYVALPGQDENPINGAKVYILEVGPAYKIAIGAEDGVTPAADIGEKWLYSLDSGGTLQALIKILNSGMIEINGNSDFAIRFDALNTALQGFVTSVNAALAGKLDGAGSPGTLTLDISTAKVNEVKLP